MHEIRCSEIWGGIRNADLDVCTSGLTASLFSSAADGGKGGDIYYFSVCGSDMLTRIAVADVQGHGEAVSDVSKMMYAALEERMNSIEGYDVLTELNRAAGQHGYRGMTTAAVIAFYLGDSNFYYAYAGHHPALVWRKSKNSWEPAKLRERKTPGNLPLGVDDQTHYDQEQTTLSRGDRMFLYTDGVIEAMNGNGEQFGETRLRSVLDRNVGRDLTEVKTAVLEAVRGHTGGSLDHDDVTFMAIEVR